MIIEDTFIQGLKIIHLNKFQDIRGDFIKVFNEDFFLNNGLETNFKESYFSISQKNVIRGMHYQVSPAAHIKLVYLNQGSILDVILDIRKNSKTFGQYLSIFINYHKPILVYIPIDCAHGYKSLENQTIVSYLQTSCYNSACDKGIKYNSFNMNWEIDNPIISHRDLTFPDFHNSNFNF